MGREQGIWPDEHVAFMEECLTNGMSARECAAAINVRFRTDYSRSAVCGRAMRAKVRFPNGSSHSRDRKPRPKPAPPAAIIVRPKPKPLLVDTVTGFRCADVEPLHLPLLELRAGQCRWPYGEENFTFCGHPTLDGDSYCVEHRHLATPVSQQTKAA